MPFTFSHPAAAIPLLGPLRRFGVLSALIIGSMTPDLPYFVAGLPNGDRTHSLAGLFWFCLPAGFAVYFFFHRVLKQPLIALLPAGFAQRLVPWAGGVLPVSSRSMMAVGISLWLGALTHIVWDSFTHNDGWPVQAFAPLQVPLLYVYGSALRTYRLLQYLSTFAGLSIVGYWVLQWYRRAPAIYSARSAMGVVPRIYLISSLLLLAAAVAVITIAGYGYHDMNGYKLQYVMFRGITKGTATLFIGLLGYCLMWRAGWLRRWQAADNGE